MNKFNVGDKVRCLQTGGWLKAGNIYTVWAVSKMGYVYLKEPFIRGSYDPENFVKVSYGAPVVGKSLTKKAAKKAGIKVVNLKLVRKAKKRLSLAAQVLRLKGLI